VLCETSYACVGSQHRFGALLDSLLLRVNLLGIVDVLDPDLAAKRKTLSSGEDGSFDVTNRGTVFGKRFIRLHMSCRSSMNLRSLGAAGTCLLDLWRLFLDLDLAVALSFRAR
jgi:hypothetical protein